MKRGKRGQVTVFIVVAIIIVAVAAVAYVVISNQRQKQIEEFFLREDIKPTVDNIRDSLIECMEQTTQNGLVLIGIQGGYYNAPNNVFDLGWAFIPYYYDRGSFLQPTNEQIQVELSNYVNENLQICVNDLRFENFEITNTNINTVTKINPGNVRFDIESRVSIEREGNTLNVELNDNPISRASLLFEILEIASFITDSHIEDPEFICINCVADLAEERDVYVDMLDFGDDTTLVVIAENKTTTEPYIFEFLNKYPIG